MRHGPRAPCRIALAMLAFALGLLFASATLAQQAHQAEDGQVPLSSLVLVLNIISDTHARPGTGVVIRSAAPAPGSAPALVLVAADFVSAGDEIIVLDGGTDILRNGRASRTVARSAQVGVALLEVEGLQRPGVALSSDPWPPRGGAAFEFAAWPPAEALASGAPLIRRGLQFGAGGLEPAAPAVGGPLFDACGRLAGLHLAADEGRLAGAASVAHYLASAGFDPAQAPCLEAAASTPAADSLPPGTTAEAQGQPAPPAAVATGADERGSPPWAGPAAGLALAGLALWIALSLRRRRAGAWLERREGGRRPARLPLRFRARDGVFLLRRSGHSIAFRSRAGRLFVSDDGGEEGGRLVLAVGGTPCLPGEVFLADSGQEIRLGAERWRVKIDAESSRLPEGAE